MHVAKPDGCQLSTSLEKCLFVIAQLRDVLAAEDSAIVAKERDHRRSLGPQ